MGVVEDWGLVECDTLLVSKLVWSRAGHGSVWFTALESVGSLPVWLYSSVSWWNQMSTFFPSPHSYSVRFAVLTALLLSVKVCVIGWVFPYVSRTSFPLKMTVSCSSSQHLKPYSCNCGHNMVLMHSVFLVLLTLPVFSYGNFQGHTFPFSLYLFIFTEGNTHAVTTFCIPEDLNCQKQSCGNFTCDDKE